MKTFDEPLLGTILNSKYVMRRKDPELPKNLFLVPSSKGSFHINLERAELVVNRMETARKNKDYFHLLPNTAPHMNLPDGINKSSKEHAIYFFMINPLDRMTNATRLWNAAKDTVGKDRFILSLEDIARADPMDINNYLRSNFGIGLTQTAENTVEQAKMLLNKYHGDPTEIFKDENFLERLQEFPGYGAELSKALATYYLKSGIIDYSLAKFVPPKIDVHKLRIPFQTGIVRSDRRSFGKDSIKKEMGQVYFMYLRKDGYDHLDFSEDLWSVASQACDKVSNNRAIRTSRIHCKAYCPLEDLCTGLIVAPDKSTNKWKEEHRKFRNKIYLDFIYVQKEVLDFSPKQARLALKKIDSGLSEESLAQVYDQMILL